MKHKTSIFLLPENVEQFQSRLKELDDALGDELDYEVIGIFEGTGQDVVVTTPVNVYGAWVQLNGQESTEVQKWNIARQLMSPESKYILLLDMFSEIDSEKLIERIKPFDLEKTIGIIGEVSVKGDAERESEIKEYILNKFIQPGWLQLLVEDFESRCCLANGNVRYTTKDMVATKTEVWDKVAGFPLISEFPFIEYQCRVQALGYEILPQN